MLSLKYLRGILQTSGSKCQSIVKLDEKSGPRKSARALTQTSADDVMMQKRSIFSALCYTFGLCKFYDRDVY